MGMYIYKVTGKIVRDDHGRAANLLKYAYKPYLCYGEEADVLNNRMRRQSGCYNAERYVKQGKTFTGRVAMEAGAESVEWTGGTMSDHRWDDLTCPKQRAAYANSI